MQEINTETYLKDKKIKRENMEGICLTKNKQKLKQYQKNYYEANKCLKS